jgi:hypothetical protein
MNGVVSKRSYKYAIVVPYLSVNWPYMSWFAERRVNVQWIPDRLRGEDGQDLFVCIRIHFKGQSEVVSNVV